MRFRLSLVAVVIATAQVCCLAQDDIASAEIRFAPVAGNIHIIEGRGGNIGVSSGPDGVLIVDDQYAPLSERIQKAIDAIGGKGKPKFILNTHWHGDHTGGNEHFGKSGTIIAHTNVRKRLSTKQELFGRVVEPLSKDGLPVITFDESLSIHFNGEEIRVLHLPHGHTDGDSVIFFMGSGVVHAGDLMFAGAFPFVDLDHGGDVQGYADNVGKLIAEIEKWNSELARSGGAGTAKEVKIIPGHGPLSTVNDLGTVRTMLNESIGTVRDAIKAGQSLEEIKKIPLARWNSWGDGFIKKSEWLETVYKSLTR